MKHILISLVVFLSKPVPMSTNGAVTMTCAHGWDASGNGTYGGVAFSLSCRSGKSSSVVVTGRTDDTFSMRMGAQSHSTALDCSLNGTAPDTQPCGPAATVSFQ